MESFNFSYLPITSIKTEFILTLELKKFIMKYNLKKTALLIEMIGGIAIIISLLFVGIQVRESSKATRSATAASTVSQVTSFYSDLGNNTEGSRIFYEFQMRPDSLNETELFQAMMNAHGIMLTIQNSYYLVEEGTLDEKIKQSLVASIIAVKDNPGFRLFWKTRKDLFFPEFQIYVEEIIKSDKKYSRELYSIE